MPEIWFPHLGIEIQKLSRVAFAVFSLNVYWYGIIITLAIVSGLGLAIKLGEEVGIDKDKFYDFLFASLIFCVIGARMYYVIFAWDTYKDDLLSIFNIRQGGLAVYGGIIAGILCIYVYTKKNQIPFSLFLDVCVAPFALGQVIGRWGNFFNREAFGGYTDSLFAMRYLKDQVSDVSSYVLDKVLTINGVEYIQVHPTFLYESLWNLGVLVILLTYRKRKKWNGQLAAMYFILYGIGRAWIEGLRTDQLKFLHTNIAVSQVLSIALVLGGIGYLFYVRRKKTV